MNRLERFLGSAQLLLFEGKVEVVNEYEDKFIRSVTFELKMPSVIPSSGRLGQEEGNQILT